MKAVWRDHDTIRADSAGDRQFETRTANTVIQLDKGTIEYILTNAWRANVINV